MIKLKIPLKTFAKINGNEKCKGQTIVCDTTYSEGVLDYIDIIGLCRRKDKTDITTIDQANVVIKLNNTEELIDAFKLYNPTDVWF